jgi:hypothetical protein
MPPPRPAAARQKTRKTLAFFVFRDHHARSPCAVATLDKSFPGPRKRAFRDPKSETTAGFSPLSWRTTRYEKPEKTIIKSRRWIMLSRRLCNNNARARPPRFKIKKCWVPCFRGDCAIITPVQDHRESMLAGPTFARAPSSPAVPHPFAVVLHGRSPPVRSAEAWHPSHRCR